MALKLLSYEQLKQAETETIEAINNGSLAFEFTETIPLSNADLRKRYGSSERGKIASIKYKKSDKGRANKRRELDKRMQDREVLRKIKNSLVAGGCVCLSPTIHINDSEHVEKYNIFIGIFNVDRPKIPMPSS